MAEEVSRAIEIAETEAIALRRFLDVYFSAAERSLAQLQVQLGKSPPVARWLGADTSPRRRADYDAYEGVTADPRAAAKAVAEALLRARASDLLHYRESAAGWEVALSTIKICLIRQAPRLSGRPCTELLSGPAVAGVFAPEIRLAALPEQAILYGVYSEISGPDALDWPAERWAQAWAQEELIYMTLWQRYRAAGVTGGDDEPSRAVLSVVQKMGLPLLGRMAENPTGVGRVSCAAENAETAARAVAATLGDRTEVRPLASQLPAFGTTGDPVVWAVRVTDKRGRAMIVCEVSNLPELTPIRVLRRGEYLVGGDLVQLRFYAAELWTVETMGVRQLMQPVLVASRQRGILAAMAHIRRRLREHPEKEWLDTELYGYVAVKPRRRGHIMADPQFPHEKT